METSISEWVAHDELAQEIEKHSKRWWVLSDTVLFHQGDQPNGIYVLKAGTVELTMTAQSRTVLAYVSHVRSVIGLPGAINNQPYTSTALAFAGAKIYKLSLQDFQRLIGTDTRLATQALQIMASEYLVLGAAVSPFDNEKVHSPS